MQSDIREDPLYRLVREHFRRMFEPAFGSIHGATDLAVAPDGSSIVIAGQFYRTLSGIPEQRLAVVDLASLQLRAITDGLRREAAPQWSPDGSHLAFLCDRTRPGDAQLALLDRTFSQVTLQPPAVDGVIESFAWSPSGTKILLHYADHGADVADVLGSGTTIEVREAGATWLPFVEEAEPTNLWRHVAIFDVATRTLTELNGSWTVWEACWCGDDALAAVISDDPREGGWYRARLGLVDVKTGALIVLDDPAPDQVGVLAGAPDGGLLAFVRACCSDRLVVAGDLFVMDTRSREPARRVDTAGVDVASLRWKRDGSLLYAGLRSLASVVGEYRPIAGAATTLWETAEAIGPRYPSVWPIDDDTFTCVVSSYSQYARIVAVGSSGAVRTIWYFAHPGSEYVSALGGLPEAVTWTGRDGLLIEGFLVTPETRGPHPLMLYVHGGPVDSFRNTWGMYSYLFTPLLVRNGFAVLHPNPRGSTGRGQSFAKMVRGDVLGEDMHDLTAGVQSMVERGVADAARIAVMGSSYGGQVASWLVTQSRAFAAAISMCPATDNVSYQYTTNIPDFLAIFLDDDLGPAGSRYYSRSPVLFAKNAATPTLNVAGQLDRCTPPTQALEFHRALVQNGVASEFVVYPEEGHGIRKLEARIDLCARMLDWLDRFVTGPDKRPRP